MTVMWCGVGSCNVLPLSANSGDIRRISDCLGMWACSLFLEDLLSWEFEMTVKDDHRVQYFGLIRRGFLSSIYGLTLPAQDLPFRRGDTLTIIAPSRDPNWYKARRYDGLEGMIPYNYVQEKKRGGDLPPPGPAPAPMRPGAAMAAMPEVRAGGGEKNDHHLRRAVKLHSMPWVSLSLLSPSLIPPPHPLYTNMVVCILYTLECMQKFSPSRFQECESLPTSYFQYQPTQ